MATIKIRAKAKGGVTTVKSLMNHPMETGQRKDKKTGEKIPRKIINKFVATYNGEEVISVDLEPAISANPYFQFDAKLPESGEFHFQWTDDDGSVYEQKKKVEVS